TKKDTQKDQDTNKPTVSSPKRVAASATKLHSPGYPKQRTAAARNGFPPKLDPQAREAERQLVQRLKERCERQTRQLGVVQGELKRAICSFDALAVATQHFFRKFSDPVDIVYIAVLPAVGLYLSDVIQRVRMDKAIDIDITY
ncbi:hypothetical protein H8959_013914, partial [Pygathrix nigripes]